MDQDTHKARHMMRLSYRGAKYHGWQTQPGDTSVQQTLEQALHTLLRKPTPITGAGRTDAGVNARNMIAHFDVPDTLTPDRCAALARSISAICAPDIVVHAIAPVHAGAHARFDAIWRTYRYYVHLRHDPFCYPLSCKVPHDLDFAAMNIAAAELNGTHDFTSFAKLHTDTKNNICTVSHAQWHAVDQNRAYFQITANRFLRNMVRAVTGTLLQVGTHKTDVKGFKDIIDKHDRCAAGTSMPAHALFLHDIEYPYKTP